MHFSCLDVWNEINGMENNIIGNWMEKNENESFYIILPLYNSFNKNRGVEIQEEKKRKKERGYYGYFNKNSLKHISFPQILPEFGRIEKWVNFIHFPPNKHPNEGIKKYLFSFHFLL